MLQKTRYSFYKKFNTCCDVSIYNNAIQLQNISAINDVKIT